MEHVYAEVPYYRAVFEERRLKPSDVACVADLRKLPILTKRIIRDRFDDLICPAYRTRMSEYQTGGSTAEPMRFCRPPVVKQWGRAAALRAWKWEGYRLGDKQVLLSGSTFDVKRLSGLKCRLERAVNRVLLLDGHVLSDEMCRQYVPRIRRFRPKVFLGYANSLFILAGYLLRNNVSDIRPEAVLSTAETLLPARRAAIERAFQCDVYDAYGSREASLFAAQCEQKAGFHVSTDTTAVEIVKDGRPAEPGELGKILLTDLKNYGMPFIRYQIEDVAVAGDEPCPCGRSLPTFRAVQGRMSNIISLPDGRHVHPLYLMNLMYPAPVQDWASKEKRIEGIARFQIVQEGPTEFVVKIIREPGTNVDYSYIARNFCEFLAEDVTVQLDFVDDIPTPASGKRQHIISKVEPRI
ncbi:MAG: hypothetical protein R6V58_13895 [Planctomycetota bacterium]